MTPAPALDLTTSLRGDLCSGAFGGNNRPYTKQRARHGSPFLEPPPLLRRAPMPSPPAKQFSGRPMLPFKNDARIPGCRVMQEFGLHCSAGTGPLLFSGCKALAMFQAFGS